MIAQRKSLLVLQALIVAVALAFGTFMAAPTTVARSHKAVTTALAS